MQQCLGSLRDQAVWCGATTLPAKPCRCPIATDTRVAPARGRRPGTVPLAMLRGTLLWRRPPHVHRSMHCATGRGRLQSWANKDVKFASLCTSLVGLPDGMGALYKRLVSCRYGPKYIQTPGFQERLAACHAHNRELTTALIENEEGAQVVLETRNGIPGSTFAALETDIRRYRASEKYSYLAALASHEHDRAAAQIQAVKDAGGNAAEKTFPDVQRKDARSSEAGTYFCGFAGCTKSFKSFDSLARHVKHEQRGYGRTGSAATAKAPTHVGYTPKTPKRGDLPAEGRRSHRKKTWDEDVGQ